MKIEQALKKGAEALAQSETPRLDARILIKHVLGTDDAGLIARANALLNPDLAAQFEALIRRRARGEPVAYLTGVKEFWSLEFKVTPEVLIPRDDSGALIEAALRRRDRHERLRIADLGTGSGCLLCVLLREFPQSTGVGVDCSETALALAGVNAEALGVGERAAFAPGDWLSSLDGPFDIIIANPPYIGEGERNDLARDVADFEPQSALFAGEDGLSAYREIIPQIPSRLSNDGLVIMECGADQADSLASMLTDIAESAGIFTMKDLAGRPRGAGFDRRL